MMRIGLHAALLAASILICATVAHAQNPASAAQGVDGLRSQLLDVQAKEAELQAREKQLDEDMQPENIERSLALTGSTRPEELREQRRRQLEAEKVRVQAQLEELATRRAHLQTAITTAETTEAYRQSIATTTNANMSSATTTTTRANTSRAPATRTVRVERRSSRTRRPRSIRHRRRSTSRRHR
jgi:hypothetical protein